MSTTAEAQPEAPQAPVAEAEKTRHEIFRYTSFIHVGDGAQECEHREDGACKDEAHFHAWIRLPNPFQVRDIAEKARAARARRMRMLKDKDSDAFVILESELDEMTEEHREAMVLEIINSDFVGDYDTAMLRVREIEVEDYVPEDESDEVPKLYSNIEQDQEEYQRQFALPEDQRTDDFEELAKTVGRFSEALDAELTKLQKPKEDRLKTLPLEELVAKIRAIRIDQSSNEAYLHTYNTWQWFVCTFVPKATGTPNERRFKDFNQFRYETPNDVIRALQVTFNHLESGLAGDRAKNS